MHKLAWLVAGMVAAGGATAEAKVRVVATVPDLAALAAEVGGDRVAVQALSLPTQDAHWVDAKPSLMLDLNKADLLIAVGAELEVGWLPALQQGARNPKINTGGAGYLDCSRHVELLEVPTGTVDRSEGDIHPTGNPHYLYDPRRALACAHAIAHKLAAIDPEGADYYAKRYTALADAMAKRRAAWEKRMAPHRGAPIVAYHKSWVYLADWLGLEIVAHLEPKPGIPPSPSHVVRVIKQAKEHGVTLLVQEDYFPTKTGELVATKIGARVVRISGGADLRKGQSYLDRVDEMVDRLAKGFAR